jgi:hypothetical protein
MLGRLPLPRPAPAQGGERGGERPDPADNHGVRPVSNGDPVIGDPVIR